MKSFKTLIVAIAACMLLNAAQLMAQADKRPAYVALTTTHWNLEKGNSPEAREKYIAMEKEYLEKVTMKNEFVNSTALLTHYYTGDNTEAILVSTYMTWADIDKAAARSTELENAAWPDKAKREAFLKELNSYYINRHSDEIYTTLDGAKLPETRRDSSNVIYMQKSYFAYPEDGTREEFNTLSLEYREKVIHKNPNLIAYYPMRHGWGADNRELVEVYVVESLCDISAVNAAMQDLEKAAWPDEAQRKAFFAKYDKYFTGQHGDFVYRSIPGVSK